MKLFVVILFSFIISGLAEHRLALVIENKNYKKHPLEYSVDHLKEVTSKLESDGFKVHAWKDLSKKDIERKLEDLLSVAPVNSTLLIYFSGYLLSSNSKGLSKNYLLMTDVEFKNPDDISRRGLEIDKILTLLEKRCGSRDKIIYLDVISQYPSESFKKATPFITVKTPKSVYIFSNTKPGEVKDSFSPSFSNYKASEKKSVLQKVQSISSWSSLSSKTLPERDSFASKAKERIPQNPKVGDEWINDLGMVFCWCPPGKYTMGSPKNMPGYEADQSQKEVSFSEGFWVSKYELTNLQYYKLRKREYKHFEVNLPNHPIITNFDEQKHLLKYIHEKSPAPSGWSYKYPTEEEWEYFARAGSSEKYFFGSDESKLTRYANFADKSLFDLKDGFYNYADRKLNDGITKIAEVGSLQPNAWGLHDVYGNVWEWCDTKYTLSREKPNKNESKNDFVVKGGSWCSLKDYCHSAFRHTFAGRYEGNFTGVRLIIKKK